MSFEQRLRKTVEPVEKALSIYLGTVSLANKGVPERLADAMRHAVLDAGKRLRPFLVMASADACGFEHRAVCQVAAAVELIHCYSLVHDDLPAMDNDTVRRGRPSVWAAFDEHTAILAGDGLLTMAFELLTDPSVELAPEIRMELVYALARAAGPSGMVGGQQLDLDAARRSHSETSTLAFVEELQALKTGALLTFSAEAGAILSGADGKLRRSLSKYGRTFGLAFQIADDLLDVEGDPATVGKALGKDAGANKATLVSLLGVEGARRQLFSLCDEAVMALEPFGPAADILRDAARFVANRQS